MLVSVDDLKGIIIYFLAPTGLVVKNLKIVPTIGTTNMKYQSGRLIKSVKDSTPANAAVRIINMMVLHPFKFSIILCLVIV